MTFSCRLSRAECHRLGCGAAHVAEGRARKFPCSVEFLVRSVELSVKPALDRGEIEWGRREVHLEQPV